MTSSNSDSGELSFNSSDKEEAFAAIARRKQEQADEQQAKEATMTPYEIAMRDMAEASDINRFTSSYARRYFKSYRNKAEGSGMIAPVGLIIAAAAIGLSMGPLTDSGYGSEQASQFLEEQGYTDVSLTEKSVEFVALQGCDGSDAVKYEFEAASVNHKQASVIVCKGLFKSATIRD